LRVISLGIGRVYLLGVSGLGLLREKRRQKKRRKRRKKWFIVKKAKSSKHFLISFDIT